MMESSGTASATDRQRSPQPVVSVGSALRKAREEKGLSVQDIANRIKFAPRQIEALEADNFANLPQATFLRGFVRSYARVLQLDEVPLLAALPGAEAQTPPAVVEQSAVNAPLPGKLVLQRDNLKWLTGALGGALVLVWFVWSWQDAEVPAAKTVTEPVALPTEGAASAVVQADPLGKAGGPVIQPANQPADQPKIADQPEQGANAAQMNKPAVLEPVAPATSTGVAAGESQPVAQDRLKLRPLHLVFSGTAWVEVMDVNGELLLSRTNLAGTEKWVGGPKRAPYDVFIDHPENVRLYHRGKEIDLSPYAGMQNIRIKVE